MRTSLRPRERVARAANDVRRGAGQEEKDLGQATDCGQQLPDGQGPGPRQTAVLALPDPRLYVRMFDESHAEDEGRSGRLASVQVHGLPVLHALLSLRHAQIRVPQSIPQDYEVPHVLGTYVTESATGVCRVLSQRRAHLRPAGGVVGDRSRAHLRGTRQVCHPHLRRTRGGRYRVSVSVTCTV